jgi:hypothetical protein
VSKSLAAGARRLRLEAGARAWRASWLGADDKARRASRCKCLARRWSANGSLMGSSSSPLEYSAKAKPTYKQGWEMHVVVNIVSLQIRVRVWVCYLCGLEKFFGAIACGNEVFRQNNVFSCYVLRDGLCCCFPAWENVRSFVWNVLDTKFCPYTLGVVLRTRGCL